MVLYILASKIALSHPIPPGFGYCPFLGGGSVVVVVESLFVVAPIVFGYYIFGPCRGRERDGCCTLIVSLKSSDCECSVALAAGDMCWSAVYKCGFSWPYSLTFLLIYSELPDIVPKNYKPTQPSTGYCHRTATFFLLIYSRFN